MTLHASKSLKLRAAFAAIGSVAVVAASAAAAAPAVVTAPPAAQQHCHDAAHDDHAAAAPAAAAAMVPEPVAVAAEAAVERGHSPFSERFPNLVLKTHEGKTIRFYDDLLAGKIVMINFMYADCKRR